MVSVKVISKSSGKPLKGRKVSIAFDGLLRGSSGSQFTDDGGEVHFDNDPGRGTVYVDGHNAKDGHISGMCMVYV